MTRTAVYPGTFDPPHLGHRDLMARAARLFDRLVVGVGTRAGKAPLFDLDERLALVRAEAAEAGGAIEVRPFAGLAVDLAAAEGAVAIVRGLRGPAELGAEQPMAGMNGAMAPGVDTLFLLARPGLAHLASSLVKEVARGGGPVERFVSAAVAAAMRARS